MILWLDDIREPWRHGYMGAEWAKTYDAAIALLKTGRVEFASLDHDLSEAATIGQPAPGEKTGYDVLLWMRSTGIWPPKGIRVHSLNPEGKKRMRALIYEHYGRNF